MSELAEPYRQVILLRFFDGRSCAEIVDGSWKYIGSGVKLGDKSRIVCWYRMKGAKTYRVVYGDLSVKDIEAKDLPLPVPP